MSLLRSDAVLSAPPPPVLPQPNTFSYSALISALARAGRWKASWRQQRWVAGMGHFAVLASGAGCHVRCTNQPSTISTPSAPGRLCCVFASRLRAECVLPLAHARANAWLQDAERYFNELAEQAEHDQDMQPNTVTYAALISGLGGV